MKPRYPIAVPLLILLSVLCWAGLSLYPIHAVGETSTRFGVFVPPSMVSGRDATLIVTAVQDGTVVDIVDDAADGDADDTATGLTLAAGQSYIVSIINGSVNDDGYGRQSKGDGDFFMVTASLPVIVASLTINTDWQHDFLPADNRRMSGTSFYLYRPPGLSGADAAGETLDVFAYNDNTTLKIIDITDVPATQGYTSVVSDALGAPVFTATLQTGQDLLEVKRQRPKLDAGRTYHLVSNKDVSVMFGALGQGRQSSRDGGAYVPGKSGSSADKTFYFVLPSAYKRPTEPDERELRLIAYDRPANVSIRGWNSKLNQWETVALYPLPAFGHAELIGSPLGSFTDVDGLKRNYFLYEVTADTTISVFETNWLETGSYGTSDIALYLSSENGTGAGRSFLAYLGPPGQQPHGQFSHLVVSSHQTATVSVFDADSYGEYVELYNDSAVTVTLGNWTLTNADNWQITLPATATVGPGKAYLMEFHQKATNAPANYVYGAAYPDFRLGNGGDTLVLRDGAGNLVDSLSYTDAAEWGSHGVYRALERVRPDLPFVAANARDSGSFVDKSAANLGAYYGTPGARPGGGATGTGQVVINEVMSGRIYHHFTLAPNGYRDVALSVNEWEALRNGEAPNTRNGNPESPYLVVKSDAAVSVLDGNWNDNWLAYGTGILLPDPYVTYNASHYRCLAGEVVTFTAYANTVYGTLFDPHTEIRLPRGIDYTPGNYSTPSQLSAVTPDETPNADGSWTIRWTYGQPMDSLDVHRFQVWGVITGSLPVSTLLQSTALVWGRDDGLVQVYSSQDSAVVNVAATNEPATAGDIVINEVLPGPSFGLAWIEIHNRSTNDVNIGGWTVGNGRAFTYTFPANTFIPNDAYFMVYLGAGIDTATRFFAGAGAVGSVSSSGDAIGLYSDSADPAATLVDFVLWDDDGALDDPTARDRAVAAGEWNMGGYVPAPGQHMSVGRDRTATDHNTALDWDNTGGPDASAITPGAINVSIAGADVTPPAPVTNLHANAIAGQPGQLVLTWNSPNDADLAGVKIARSMTGYPYSLDAGEEIYDGLTRVVTDTGLKPGALVYYAAFAYDETGNLSYPIGTALARAIVPQRVYLAFEDQKGAGWADWDTNDLAVIQDTAVGLGETGIQRIEVLLSAEARGSAYDHELHLNVPLVGASWLSVQRYNAAGALLSTESRLVTGTASAVVFTRTKVALPATPGQFTANVVSGTAKIPGFSARILITPSVPSANPPETALLPPFDPWLRVLDTGAEIHLMQAGSVGNSQRVWYAGPLAGRDLPLALSFDAPWKWPLEQTPIWESYGGYGAYITSGGTLATDWFTHPDLSRVYLGGQRLMTGGKWSLVNDPWWFIPGATGHVAQSALWTAMTGGPIVGSPLIIDLDGDGSSEVIAVSENRYVYVWRSDGLLRPGWPQSVAAGTRSSPAAGDLDGDGDLEVVFGSNDGRLDARHKDGSLLFTFPVLLGGSIKSAPALADLDGAPGLEIIVHASDAKVYALDGQGRMLDGWPQSTGGVSETFGNLILNSTPAVGDLDADGSPEVVVGGSDGRVHVWRADGTPFRLPWPRSTGDLVYASPVIVDLDRDGYRDVVAASGDGFVYAWRGDGWLLSGFPARLGSPVLASPAVVDLDRNGDIEIVVATLDGRVFVLNHDGSTVVGWPQTVDAAIQSSPVVGDLDGDGDQEIVVGSHDGRLHAWHDDGFEWNSEAMPWVDWPKQTGDWIVAAPALGDVDGNGSIDVVAASYDGRLYVWGEKGAHAPSNTAWPAFHANPQRTGVVDTDTPLQPLPAPHTRWLPIVVR